MIYLLAKYTLLFLIASVLGFVLGYWWSRRNFVDVSESYEDLRKATEQTDAANWNLLWNRLDALPEPKETDLSSVVERLDGVQGAVAGIPKPDTVDLVPVESQLKSLSNQIANLPVPKTPKEPDFSPLTGHIEKLEKEIDLRPVRNELASIREQINGLPKVETHKPVDLAPVTRQIDALEKRVSTISQPEKVDLKPIDGRLRSIESEISRLGKRLSRSVQSAETNSRGPARSRQRTEPPKILSAALYGKQDDLKSISGVGPKLERLLNKNGVFYFWQVASWSHGDIEKIDQRLDTFKGRISRDDWVAQAKQLTRSPGAASIPAG